MSKILAFLAAAGAFLALIFRGKFLKEKLGRTEDREKVKDKSHEIQQKSTKARHKGERKEREARKQPVDYDKDDDRF